MLKKIVMSAAIAVAGTASVSAQTNLGAACGCPSVGSRPTVNMSTLADGSGNLLAANTVLTCDKKWIINDKIFVGNGKSITIQPGTALFATSTAGANADALVISRGGKIFAAGTETCPIVFTAVADPLDGTYSVGNQQQWGGLVILGRATNNLLSSSCNGTQANAYQANGIGLIEGFIAADPRAYYGADLAGTFGPAESFDDNDNSGIVRYVSLRHGGATASTANELNGLTLGSVGRGTTIDHVEIVSNSDDGFEMFGGTVNLKYCAVQYNDDDAFDWDQGYRGKGQFWFAVKASGRGDNGFEMDSDDNHCLQAPTSRPIVYNATVIGDDTDAGLEAKENTEGEIYNSIIANYQQGLNIYNQFPADVYTNWNNNTFKVQNSTFVSNAQSALTIQPATTPVTATGGDVTKFTTDGNIDAGASIPGFDFTTAVTLTGSALAAVTDVYDASPTPALTSTITAPADGFFSPVNYRGAFATNAPSWLNNWSYAAFIDATNGLVPCPTDTNGDGVTNITDFNAVLGAFGTTCD